MTQEEARSYAAEVAAELLRSALRDDYLEEDMEERGVPEGERELVRQATLALTVELYRSAGVQVCRACGCTEDDACEGGCSWVEEDLCSSCKPEPLIVPP